MSHRVRAAGAAVLLSLVLSGSGECQQRENRARFAGWSADIDTLVERARQMHASPGRPAHSRQFAQAAADLRSRIADLPDHRMAVEIQRLVAMLGDGHSLVYPMPSRAAALGMLPIDVYLFADGLHVVRQHDVAEALVGSRILRFGALTTEQLIAGMTPYVSRDNDIAIRAFASLYPIIPEYVEAWGGTDSVDRIELTIEDTLGAIRKVTVAAQAPRRTPRRLFAPASARVPAPLYLRNAERNVWFAGLPEHDALYVQFNQVVDAPDMTLASAARRLSDTIAVVRPRNLIIDVRHNNGGNNMLLNPLLDAITSFASESDTRRVYVLTGRSTFSAAQNFINRIERRVPHAIFAGEPSMSRPNFTGEDNPIRLPYSGLVISISNRYWQDSSPADERPWIAPHIPVSVTGRDWLRNTDPVLERVLDAIRSAR